MNEEKTSLPLGLIEVTVYGADEAGETKTIVADLNLSIAKGEWLTIVGVNGSGKSTAARLIAGLPAGNVAGTVERGFAGDYPAAYVMQQPDAQLFGQTPREELRFALEWQGMTPSVTDVQAEAMLEAAGLSEAADRPWSRLSGGQRQMAAIAAACAGNPELVVFDEATSMLDDGARRRARSFAGRLRERGAAIVWVTQRLEELEPGERVVAFADGRIRFDGDVRQFLYGRDEYAQSLSPCEQVGLRLPYLARLARELCRSGKLFPPLPVTAEDWRRTRLRPKRAEA